MSVRLITDSETNYTVLYCSTTMRALAPVFDTVEDAEAFLHWFYEVSRRMCDRIDPRQHLYVLSDVAPAIRRRRDLGGPSGMFLWAVAPRGMVEKKLR